MKANDEKKDLQSPENSIQSSTPHTDRFKTKKRENDRK